MSLQNNMLEKVPLFQGIWLNPYPGAWVFFFQFDMTFGPLQKDMVEKS